MKLTNSEINTLIAACMLASSRYTTQYISKMQSTYLTKECLRLEALKYKNLEEKLREHFYERNQINSNNNILSNATT